VESFDDFADYPLYPELARHNRYSPNMADSVAFCRVSMLSATLRATVAILLPIPRTKTTPKTTEIIVVWLMVLCPFCVAIACFNYMKYDILFSVGTENSMEKI
jgi:hypothetical protein